MNYKIIGVFCVFAACGSFGFIMAAHHAGRIRLFRDLVTVLDYMVCELQYRGMSLPALCRHAGEQSQGKVRQIFTALADELDAQISPDAERCMASVLDKLGDVEISISSILKQLGTHLGKFDLNGQIRGLECCREHCQSELKELINNKDSRLRSYQTLGLCAGAALAILFV